jgi:hypothetical protein
MSPHLVGLTSKGGIWMLRALSPLRSAILVVPVIFLLACRSTPHQGLSPKSQIATNIKYPARPNTSPLPLKVFHTTDNSITLVTDASATDDQIAAILWQLHDAAHNNTFAALHVPQQFVDKRDPMIWFHIYRGSKCASEKYTRGPLPCGPSYHAAGDYTLGSFSKKDRDDGVILHGDDKQTELWNPDPPH